MIGEYARVTVPELDRAISDPQWALDRVNELIEAEIGTESAGEDDTGCDAVSALTPARCLDTDKAWDAIGFLLRRTGFPVDIVHGEHTLPGAEDWGYGPPRYLTAEQVRAAADALAARSVDDLFQGVTPDDLARSDIYPRIVWERGESLEYVRHHLEALVPFFRAAAREGDAMLMWLD